MNRTLILYAMLFGVIALAAAGASIAANNPHEQKPAAEANNPREQKPAAEVSSPKPTASIAATIRIDASQTIGELKPVHRFFGADEPNYAYMKDGKKLLGELGSLGPAQTYFRAHNLLTSGDGTPALKWGSTNAFTKDKQGKPIYDWTIVDRIFDAYLDRGVRPYAQIGFMPQDLSINPDPYRHRWSPTAKYNEIFTGWAYPPRDYAEWGELVYRWVDHCVKRYGRAEVESWYWEVWNEPNIGYWRGKPEEFLKLHDYAIAAVRRALPTARVGGPDVAGSGGKFMRMFLDHVLKEVNFATGERGTPIDFVSFHAKGAPRFVADHVRMGIAEQLRTIDDGFSIVASYPELKNKPIVIGECDPDGCAACRGPQLGYRNTTLYAAYTAASFARLHELADRCGVNLEGALTWAFEFEDQPYFAGFRALASNGIDLPVLNVFRMFGMMSGRRVKVESDRAIPLATILSSGVRGDPDVSAIASLDHNKLYIFTWHYHDDDVPGAIASIRFEVSGLPIASGNGRITRYLIDDDHSNAYTVWKKQGSPEKPSADQYAELERSGRLAKVTNAESITVTNGAATIEIPLQRRGVTLIVVEPRR